MTPWRNTTTIALGLTIGVAIAAGRLLLIGSGSEPAPVEPHSLSSRYGRLTSERWADGAEYRRRDLEPVGNPNPDPEPQPARDHPYHMALTPDGSKLYVTLPGNESEPGHEVAVYDVRAGRVDRRIKVGRRPWYVRMHPGGRHALVSNLYSNYISVIDVGSDEVVDEIPADFYCQDISIEPQGRRAWVANRYLGQLLELELSVEGSHLRGRVVPRAGFDDSSFLTQAPPEGSVREVLRRRCGGSSCHDTTRSGFYAGRESRLAFVSAAENAIPGRPADSAILRAVRSREEGGFADDLAAPNFHADGQAILRRGEPDDAVISRWIEEATDGPGIPVGNPGSRPMSLATSSDGRFLYVSNLGVPDVAVIDLHDGREVTAVHIQNLPLDVATYSDGETGAEWLFVASMGAGFGAPKERDPFGGETTERDHRAAQFSVRRDPRTSRPFPIERQEVLGPFDAVDGTAAFKMRDIQNDIIAVNLSRLEIPQPDDTGMLSYALVANRYESHRGWVRYTSDSAESLEYDIHGDIPPDLMRIIGAIPAALEVEGDDLYVVMSGTYELVRYRIDPRAGDPSELLTPVDVFETGLMPRDVEIGRAGTPAEGLVFVSNYMGETLSVVELSTREIREIVIGDLSRPVPDTNAERGELFVNTAVFSVDQDTACFSCHIYDTGDGRSWGAGQVIGQLSDGELVSGGVLAIPQIRNLWDIQPFYFEGTHTAFDAQFDDAKEHVASIDFDAPVPGGDFTSVSHPIPPSERRQHYEEIQERVSLRPIGVRSYDLAERRDEFIRQQTQRFFGKAFNFSDFQRFIGEYQVAETRLMPNPFDQQNLSVARGRSLFDDPRVGCGACHIPPSFTEKGGIVGHGDRRSVPPLVTITKRDASYTLFSPSYMNQLNDIEQDVEPWEKGRVESEELNFTIFQLRGLFDRPHSFLHHGRALSLREVLATPNHPSLRRFTYAPLRGGEVIRPGGWEVGFNETTLHDEGAAYIVDTHGATSHLNSSEIQDLINMLLAIE